MWDGSPAPCLRARLRSLADGSEVGTARRRAEEAGKGARLHQELQAPLCSPRLRTRGWAEQPGLQLPELGSPGSRVDWNVEMTE